MWSELLEGFRYVMCHRTIRGLLVVVAVASIFGRGALEMMPAFVDAVLQRGSSGLAILTSAIGAGSIATGLVLSRGTAWLDTSVIRIAVIAAGVLVVAFGATEIFWLSILIVTGIGVMLSLCGVGSQILIQSLVDEEVRGRVSSFWGMIAFGGTAVGSLVIGTASAAFGLQGTIVVTGMLCVAASALFGRPRQVL